VVSVGADCIRPLKDLTLFNRLIGISVKRFQSKTGGFKTLPYTENGSIILGTAIKQHNKHTKEIFTHANTD
jgi:hypothetical protein